MKLTKKIYNVNKVKCYQWAEPGSEFRIVWLKTFALSYSLNKFEWNTYICKILSTEEIHMDMSLNQLSLCSSGEDKIKAKNSTISYIIMICYILWKKV